MRPWNRKDLRGHRPAYIPPHCRPCRDHTGREFSSLQAMCDFWHINISTYHNRLRAGMLLRQILTAPVKGRNS